MTDEVIELLQKGASNVAEWNHGLPLVRWDKSWVGGTLFNRHRAEEDGWLYELCVPNLDEELGRDWARRTIAKRLGMESEYGASFMYWSDYPGVDKRWQIHVDTRHERILEGSELTLCNYVEALAMALAETAK